MCWPAGSPGWLTSQPQPAASESTVIELPEDAPSVWPPRSATPAETPETSAPWARHSAVAWATAAES